MPVAATWKSVSVPVYHGFGEGMTSRMREGVRKRVNE